LTLTTSNAHPGDKFHFWTFPEGTTLDQAREEGIAAATYVGDTTVNQWIAGVGRGSCSTDTTTTTTSEPPVINTNTVEGSGNVHVNVDCYGLVTLDDAGFEGLGTGSYTLDGVVYYFTMTSDDQTNWTANIPVNAAITSVTVYVDNFPPITIPVAFGRCGEVVETGNGNRIVEASMGYLGGWDPVFRTAGSYSQFYITVNGKPVGAMKYVAGDTIHGEDPNGDAVSFVVPQNCGFYRVMVDTHPGDDLAIVVDGLSQDIPESSVWVHSGPTSCNYDPINNTVFAVFGQTLGDLVLSSGETNLWGDNGAVAGFREHYGSTMIVVGQIYKATWK
jgi:hypothetical protein